MGQIELAVTSLPESVVDELIEEQEGGDKISRERKLELLKEQEKLVIEEQRVEDDELEEQKIEIKRKKEEEKNKQEMKQQRNETQEDEGTHQDQEAAPLAAEDVDAVGGT